MQCKKTLIATTLACHNSYYYYNNDIIIVGTQNSAPSQLLSVCVRAEVMQHGIVIIFWDPFPCHLQNGADITDYIIQYRRTSGGEARNYFTGSDESETGVDPEHLICDEVSTLTKIRYRCLLPIPESSYIFQIAAINRFGVGPLSDPVIADMKIQSKINYYYGRTSV